MRLEPKRSALLVIDVQKAFAEIEAAGGRRNNPDALANVARLVAAFRTAEASVFHIRHASREVGSRFRPDAPGYAVMDEARDARGEPVIVKHVNSAFIGTDLEARLRAAGIATLVIVGATTNHCVETTTRMAGNLGFDARLVRDATWTFERTGPDGDHHGADEIHRMTLANLSGEFAAIVTTNDVLDGLQARPATAAA
jgi:nicotinamidase-related amidase